MTCYHCANPFEETLHYASPAHGGWGVVRMGHLMPESYHLFVSPAACGRHGALSACMQGRKNRVSYLYLSEDDIVSGGYEDLLLEAVDELLSYLKQAKRFPKVLMIFVSCIDDLLGTDHEALSMELKERHPEVRFTFCHMNPTSTDTNVPPPVNIRNKLYGLLDVTSVRDHGINLLGSLVPLDPACELFHLLPQMGVGPIRHITDYHTFSAFQEMARSRLNLVLAPMGQYAAQQMEKTHQIPFHLALTTYDPTLVTEAYQNLAHLFHAPCPDLSGYEQACEEAMETTRMQLDGMPIVIDGEAIARPFDLARALLRRGFQVERMLVQKVVPTDQKAYDWVRKHVPDITIQQPQHHRASLFQNRLPDCLAIGYNSAYITGSNHIVASDGQTGHWGYQGILDMLKLIQQAVQKPSDLRMLIDAAGLVV